MSDRSHVRPLSGDLRYPGHGMPPRAQDELEALSAWSRLCEGGALGKKGNVVYDAAGPSQETITMIDVQGSDRDACPLIVTLAGPYAVPRAAADYPLDLQNMTGELDNANVGTGNYPGTAGPIVWPPFVAIVEWGVGGTRAVAYVDWREGATIGVPASFLRVTPIIPPDALANAPGTSGVYTLSAFASPGFPRSRNAQRTVFLGVINANAESNVFAVPPFAERATLIGLDPTAEVTSGSIQFWRSPDGTSPAGAFFQSGNQPIGFPVPNGAAYFTITSGVAGNIAFAVCFDLSI